MAETATKKVEIERPFNGRGQAYPAISLMKAMELVEEVQKNNLARSTVSPDIFYKIWGYKGESGATRPLLAALNHYGLMEYVGRGESKQVRLSALAHRIIFDKVPDSKERSAALQDAALAPSIFAKLMAELKTPVPPQVVVETYLTRDCGYSEQVSQIVYRNYIETLGYAGLNKPADILVDIDEKPLGGRSNKGIAVGDLVQIEIGGALQLDQPKRVRAVQEHDGQQWVFIAGSETGILMEQVQLIEKARVGSTLVAPRLAEDPLPDLKVSEREWLRGPLSRDTSYRLVVSGELGPKELGKLIKLLEAQKAILDEDNDDR